MLLAESRAVPGVLGNGTRGNGDRAVLEVSGLTKRFGDTVAVNGLSFTVAAGEVLGFLGPNGAGKSTTVGIILGLVRADAGTVLVCGRDVAAHQDVVSTHIGAIMENPAFYPYLSGRDNLKAHALAVGGVDDARIDHLLQMVNLNVRGNDAYKTYSLGMKQRLGLASTLLTDPALVILDEPTNGLDPAGQREIRSIIPRLADEGHAVLLASHLLHEVEQVSDRVAIIRHGELITEGSVDELLKRGGSIDIHMNPADLPRARAILRRCDHVEQVTDEEDRLVVVAPLEAGSEMNRCLVDAGIYASAIIPRRNSLEALFLELTDGSTV